MATFVINLSIILNVICGNLGECPHEGSIYEGYCYWVEPGKAKTIKEAYDGCARHGGNLAYIPDNKTTSFINDSFVEVWSAVWIGVYRLPGILLSSAGDEQIFTNWKPGEPGHEVHDEPCVVYFGGQWHDIECESNNFPVFWNSFNGIPALCYMKTNATSNTSDTTVVTVDCSSYYSSEMITTTITSNPDSERRINSSVYDLRIHNNQTNAYWRLKNSVYDDRISSKTLGWTAAVILIVLALVPVASDLHRMKFL